MAVKNKILKNTYSNNNKKWTSCLSADYEWIIDSVNRTWTLNGRMKYYCAYRSGPWGDSRGTYFYSGPNTNNDNSSVPLPKNTNGTYYLKPKKGNSSYKILATGTFDDQGTAPSVTVKWKWGVYSNWGGMKAPSGEFTLNDGGSIGPKTYVVNYSLNGGSGTFNNQTKTYGVDLTLYTTIPSRTGYTFTGWSGSDGNSYAAGATFTGNYALTLTAQWSINSYYLDLNGWLSSNGGTSYASSGNITNYGTVQVFINEVPLSGRRSDYYTDHPYGTTYTFGNIQADTGHRYEGVYSGSVSGTIGASSVSVYLKFRTNKYYIFYDLKGGTGTINSQTKIYGTDLILTSSTPSKSGYDFLGWDTSSAGTTVVYAPGATLSTELTNSDYADQGYTDPKLYAVWRVTKPSNVRFTSSAATSPFNISLSWTCDGLAITGYVIHYKPIGGTERTINCGTSTSLNLAVNEETTYEIWVTATNAGGSTNSAHIQLTTPADQAKIRIYNGSSWLQGKTYIYNGSTWVKAKKVYIYDGSVWKINSNN